MKSTNCRFKKNEKNTLINVFQMLYSVSASLGAGFRGNTIPADMYIVLVPAELP